MHQRVLARGESRELAVGVGHLEAVAQILDQRHAKFFVPVMTRPLGLRSLRLAEIVRQRCRALRWQVEPELLTEIAQRGKATPRIALRLLQSARRFQVSEGSEVLTVEHLRRACEIERISDLGLDNMQQKYLALLAGGPQRLNVLASMLGVSTKVLTKTVEGFLLRSGMIVKDDQGRRNLTEIGQVHLASLRPVSE